MLHVRVVSHTIQLPAPAVRVRPGRENFPDAVGRAVGYCRFQRRLPDDVVQFQIGAGCDEAPDDTDANIQALGAEVLDRTPPFFE